MARSFGLKAYRALAGRTANSKFTPSSVRPKGELVWIHAPEPGSLPAVRDLADRLRAARYDLAVLITLADKHSFESACDALGPDTNVLLELAPPEHPDAIKAFWTHWHPDMCLWMWGQLRPNLLVHAHDCGCPVIVIDADTAGFDSRRDRWLPDLSRQLLDPCAAIMVRSGSALQRMESLGMPIARVDLVPPLEAGGQILPCNETDLADLTSVLRGRPVWLANSVHPEELQAILSAHRTAMRLSHRLLLILMPAKAGFDRQFTAAAEAEGFRIVDWNDREEPDDAAQILLSTDARELGLFYRVAPVTLMGGTLADGNIGRNPFEAAALGSAVVYGPHVRRFDEFYKRLTVAGAARRLDDQDALGATVTRLIAPDQAATMAHAGWDVVSQGAAVTDRVIDLVQAGLDGDLEGANASP